MSMVFVNGNDEWVIGSAEASELVTCVGFVSMNVHVKAIEMSQISQAVRGDRGEKDANSQSPPNW